MIYDSFEQTSKRLTNYVSQLQREFRVYGLNFVQWATKVMTPVSVYLL